MTVNHLNMLKGNLPEMFIESIAKFGCFNVD